MIDVQSKFEIHLFEIDLKFETQNSKFTHLKTPLHYKAEFQGQIKIIYYIL